MVAPNAAATLAGSAAKAAVKALWSKVTEPSRVRETPAAPARLTMSRSCCWTDRTVGSPISGPAVFFVASYAVADEICPRAVFSASTSLLTWPATWVPSIVDRTVTPLSTLPTVNDSPGTTPLNVFDGEVIW